MNQKTIRFAQAFVILVLGIYAGFVFLGNLMDYNSNYQFVKHVFAMDTTFPGNALEWRAIKSGVIVDLAYWFIIALEGVIALLGLFTGIRLLLNLNKTPERFTQLKSLGVYAFLLAITLWFVGFICVGSEWFAMWQSETWNGKQTAMDIVEVVGIFLIIYLLPERLTDKTSKN